MTPEQERRQTKRYRKLLSRHEFVQDTKQGLGDFFKKKKYQRMLRLILFLAGVMFGLQFLFLLLARLFG